MRTRATDIFNTYHLEVWNKFLHTHAQTSPNNENLGNKHPLLLFLSIIFFCFLSYFPVPVFAGETGITDISIPCGNLSVPLPFLVVAAVWVITAGSAFAVRRKQCRLRSSRITPQEFTKVTDNMLKSLLLLSLSALPMLPLAAQEAAPDSAYTFRFVRGKETFLVPYRDNAPTLRRIIQRLDSCRSQLRSGYFYVNITGYVPRGTNEAATYRTGYLRNSRVKSELIVRSKLAESMFVTDKVIVGTTAGGLTDVVVVTFPAPVEKVERIAGKAAAEKMLAYLEETRPNPVPQDGEPEKSKPEETPLPAAEPVPEPEVTQPAITEPTVTGPEATAVPAPHTPEVRNSLLLRANLLRWATLTPDLGVEWRITPAWGVLLHGSWTSWSRDNGNRCYALWNISPAIHYYMGVQKRAYAGVLFQTGGFNYKFSGTGRQGEYYGGGLTGGYRLPLGKRLMADFSLGAGYTRAGYDKYAVTDNVRVKRGKENRNYWGVNHAGITLVWQLK